MLGMLNDELVFGSDVFEGDPWASEYTVKPGDSLSRIVSREDLKIDWRLLQMINGLDRPEKIQVGQTIKILHGPFHAEVSKSNHQLDLFMGEGPERVFVKSYTVGLGQFDSTPTGRFRVRKGQKIVNPTWTNPRTGNSIPRMIPRIPSESTGWVWKASMPRTRGSEDSVFMEPSSPRASGQIHPWVVCDCEMARSTRSMP